MLAVLIFLFKYKKTALGERGFTNSRLLSFYIGFSRSKGFINKTVDHLVGIAMFEIKGA